MRMKVMFGLILVFVAFSALLTHSSHLHHSNIAVGTSLISSPLRSPYFLVVTIRISITNIMTMVMFSLVLVLVVLFLLVFATVLLFSHYSLLSHSCHHNIASPGSLSPSLRSSP